MSNVSISSMPNNVGPLGQVYESLGGALGGECLPVVCHMDGHITL